MTLLIFTRPGYLEIESHLFHGGRDFEISMDFRTDQFSALLLFTYNTHTEDYMLVSSNRNTAYIHIPVRAFRMPGTSLARCFNKCLQISGGAGSRPASRQSGLRRSAD